MHDRNYQIDGVIDRQLRNWRMFFQEFSLILATVGISASQEEYILIACRNLSISPPPQEYLQVSFDSSCKYVEDSKESWNTFDGDVSLLL